MVTSTGTCVYMYVLPVPGYIHVKLHVHTYVYMYTRVVLFYAHFFPNLGLRLLCLFLFPCHQIFIQIANQFRQIHTVDDCNTYKKWSNLALVLTSPFSNNRALMNFTKRPTGKKKRHQQPPTNPNASLPAAKSSHKPRLLWNGRRPPTAKTTKFFLCVPPTTKARPLPPGCGHLPTTVPVKRK